MDNMRTANHSRSFYGGPNPSKAKFVDYKLARHELGRCIRIITGHNNLGCMTPEFAISAVREMK